MCGGGGGGAPGRTMAENTRGLYLQWGVRKKTLGRVRNHTSGESKKDDPKEKKHFGGGGIKTHRKTL